MPTHSLGGDWTEIKLNCVRQYAEAWSKIMARNAVKFGWKTRYIDAFSGAGTYAPRTREDKGFGVDSLLDTDEEGDRLRKGSALNAVEMKPPFDQIDLIEKNPEFAKELRSLASSDIDRRVFVHCEDVNMALPRLCRSLSKRDERAVVFIDPYGCEVDWETLKAVAASEVADVWYLVPTNGINRQLSKNPGDIEQYKRDRLTRCLGTTEWENAFYSENEETDLFGQRITTQRKAGPDAVENFIINRLQTIFPFVYERCLQLHNSRKGHLFSLCFAVSNPSPKAHKPAESIASSIIRKWGKKS